MTRFIFSAAIVLALGANTADAQGNLSTQGFGYPPGQLSTTAMSLGGGNGELDPASALNPATAALWGASVLFMQYEPELRTVKTPGGSSRTTTARFPMVGISIPLVRRLTGQISASTFLDRTWSSASVTKRDIGGTIVDVTEVFSSNGGITDFRLALAYSFSPRFQLGVAGHVFSGENRVIIEQRFPDTVTFSGATQQSEISYGALGASAGMVWRPSSNFGIGASVRVGGDIEAQAADTVVSSAKMPTRYGASITYSGISGVALSARANFDGWDALEPLRRPGPGSFMKAYDGLDYGVGADVAGPTIGRRNIALRLGARHRRLPFGAGSGAEPSRVNETSFSGGVGIPLGVGRSQLDIGLARAARTAERESAVAGATESAYIFSFGVRVRP